MIIVEGPDGAGKTTLVSELLDEFPELRIGKRGTKDRSKLWTVTRKDTYRALAEACNAKKPHIWDRLFWSEFAYWEVTGREKCEFGPDDLSVVPGVIRALHAPVIWCMPPEEVVIANVKLDKQMEGVEENIQHIYSIYQAMLGDSVYVPTGTNLMTYNYLGENAIERKHQIFSMVEGYLAARNGRLA